MVSGASVRPAVGADWQALRAVRLRALERDPAAFGSTLEQALAVDDDEYLRRAAVGTTHLALEGDEPVGIVALVPDDDDASGVELVSTWVDPRHRGTGLADRLVEAACTAGRLDGVREVTLDVGVDNGRARRLYERCAFVRTGRVRAVRPDEPERLVERMHRSLALPSAARLVWTSGPGGETFPPPPADGGPHEGAGTGLQMSALRALLGAEVASGHGGLPDETLTFLQDQVDRVVGRRAMRRFGDQVGLLAPGGDLTTVLADPVLCQRLLRGLLAPASPAPGPGSVRGA